MPPGECDFIVNPPKSADKSLKAKEVKKRQPNFFNSPDRVTFPAIINGNVSTKDFLAAFFYITSSFELLGPLMGNVTRLERMNYHNVRRFYEKDPTKHQYIKDMLLAEKANNEQDTAESLIQIIRTVKSLNEALQNAYHDTLKSGTFDINAICYETYKKYTYPYQNFFFRQLYKTGLLVFLPATNNFAKCLSFGQVPDSLLGFLEDAVSYMESFQPLIEYLDKVYIDNDLPIDYGL